MSKRAFRSPESYAAEEITRSILPSFVASCGFINIVNQRKKIGSSVSQTIVADDPAGAHYRMRVKLCWRRSGKRNPTFRYSAAQLVASVSKGNWVGDLNQFISRMRSEGVTHMLFVLRDGNAISLAALVPAEDVVPLWCAERDKSDELIRKGFLGRRKKNHAKNGSSPTVWIEDEQAPEIHEIIWPEIVVRR